MYTYWIEYNKQLDRFRVVYKESHPDATILERDQYCKKCGLIETFSLKADAQKRLTSQKEEHQREAALDEWIRVEDKE